MFVKMYLRRKDSFYTSYKATMAGTYADDDLTGILRDSRIYFGFVRGPRADLGPGP
ncbi:hypothetical protein BJY00DRAFT_289724 [Aspergillus carlsbadensis]|nr:hypothetical protein BJY00DRAFT_289724 [Aspergillus carlsbadensis]